MDNLRFKLYNKRIPYETIVSFNNNSFNLIDPSENNIIEENKIFSKFKIYNRNSLGKDNKGKEPFLNLVYRANKEESIIIVTGSVRKWHFGANSSYIDHPIPI